MCEECSDPGHEEPPTPRLRVIDVTSTVIRHQSRRGRGKRREIQQPVPALNVVADRNYSLEMQPVLRATTEYGKRAFALGLLKGASTMKALAQYIIEQSTQSHDELAKYVMQCADSLTNEARIAHSVADDISEQV